MGGYRSRMTTPGAFRGARVILVEALPAVLPAQLVREAVSACAFERMGLELLVQNAAAAGGGRLGMYLVLRTSEQSGQQLAQRLDGFAQRMLAMLRTAGFAARIAAAEDDEELCGCLQNVPGQQAGVFYAPPCTEKGFFHPQRMAEMGELPFEAVMNALAQCPGAAVSLLLQSTGLYPAEKRVIGESLAYFSDEKAAEDPRSEPCRSTFAALDQLDGKPLFFACMAVRFSGAMPAPLGSLMASRHLAWACVPPVGGSVEEWLNGGDISLSSAAQHLCLPDAPEMRISPWMRRFSFLMSWEEAAASLALPRYGHQLHGVRVVAAAMDHQPISEELTQRDGIPLGVRFENDEEVYLPVQQLATHASIVGMPGMGKTTAAMGMVYALHEKGYPTLILEPAKTEFRALMDVIPEMRVYTPGRSQAAPMGLNPFLPPRGVALEQYLPNLTTAFTAAFAMTRPLNVIFPDVLKTCYTRYGWRMSSTRDDPEVTRFGLREFIAVYREAIENSGYDPESRANLLSGGVYRLTSLINSNPTLYDTDFTLPFDTLLKKPTLIELDAIDNTEQKSLLTTLILLNLSLVVRQSQIPDGKAKNFIMIDEAHVLLNARSGGGEGDADPAGMAVSLLQNMVMTFRAYGTGIIFADQSPEKLTRSIIDFTNVRISLRLESTQDRELLAGAMGMNQGVTAVMRTLLPGQAYFGCRLLDRPIRICLPDAGEKLGLRHDVSAEEIALRMGAGKMQRPFAACESCLHCKNGCSGACRTEASFLADTLCDRLSAALNDRENVLTLVHDRLPAMIAAAAKELSPRFEEQERLRQCALLQMKRRLLLKGPVGLTMRDMDDE